jgi:hypothetical protein
MRAFGADGIASCFAFVAAEIVEDHDITLSQRWGEDLGGVDGEELAVDGTVDCRTAGSGSALARDR